MRKTWLGILICSLICGLMCTGVSAQSDSTIEQLYPQGEVLVSQTVQPMDDGTVIIVTVSEQPGGRGTKTGSKTHTCKSGSDTLWTFTEHGTFTYTSGVSSQCTSAYYTYNIVDTAWSLDSGTSAPSGNKAIGHGKFVRKILFIVVETKECDVTLQCDKYGNLS